MHSKDEQAKDKQIIEFPCDFPIKAIGYANIPVADILTEIIHKNSKHMEYIPVTINQSKNAKFVAATAIVKALNREQLDNIYKELSSCAGILMVF